MGLQTFLLPLNPGKGVDGEIIDYGGTAFSPVWTRSRPPDCRSATTSVTPPKTPCEVNSVIVGMMINVDGFREPSKYLFSGILTATRASSWAGSRAVSPGGHRLQDAEHLLASHQHMFNRKVEHDVRYYWDNHMSASFMVDPLACGCSTRSVSTTSCGHRTTRTTRARSGTRSVQSSRWSTPSVRRPR